MPAPALTLSSPSPPDIVSAPLPPDRPSFPAPPKRRSLPCIAAQAVIAVSARQNVIVQAAVQVVVAVSALDSIVTRNRYWARRSSESAGDHRIVAASGPDTGVSRLRRPCGRCTARGEVDGDAASTSSEWSIVTKSRPAPPSITAEDSVVVIASDPSPVTMTSSRVLP